MPKGDVTPARQAWMQSHATVHFMSLQQQRPQKRSRNHSQPAVSSLTGKVSLSQLDVPERFGADQGLGPEEWVSTVPLNAATPYPEARGLPPLGTSAEETYQAAQHLRDSPADASDGVYCPVCHIANTQLRKLHRPCPKCGRALLRFGWG
jgi:hypothetical protein